MSEIIERVARAIHDPNTLPGDAARHDCAMRDWSELSDAERFIFLFHARVAIAAYEAAQWQPIETAPRDRYILLRFSDRPRWDGNMDVGKWFGDDEETACFWSTGGPNGGLELLDDYTHWRELPPDPSED